MKQARDQFGKVSKTVNPCVASAHNVSHGNRGLGHFAASPWADDDALCRDELDVMP
jgi:hypothetical protein